MSFEDKRVLVTGSSRGIGLATARAFLDRGARVAINGRSEGSVEAAMDTLGSHDRLAPAPGDVSSLAACDAVVGQAVEALGGLDILVNNAGIYVIKSVEDTDEALWDGILDTGLKAAFFCSRAALPALRDSKGTIINISSSAGLMGFPRIAAYCAAKAGLVNLTRSLALELAPDVRVNCVCPGPVDTAMGRTNLDQQLSPAEARTAFEGDIPLGRMGEPEEVADAIVWLASGSSSYVTGAIIAVDGGRTVGGTKRQSD
jgi:NAD(P)-dependent dehydrogenase (short-subunit alcohol dehydrogenase family)